MDWGQEALGIKLLAPLPTAQYVLVASLSESSITCNGVTQTPAAVGADRGTPAPGGQTTMMYATVFLLQTGGVETPYTVSQDGNTDGGTIPAYDYNKVVLATCDDATYKTSPVGPYGYIRRLREQGDRVLLIWLDDMVYADRNGTEQDDTGYTGHKATNDAQTSLLEYDYAMAYACQLGLLGNPRIPAIRAGHDPDRKWCNRNVPTIPAQTGDHPHTDNAGWSTNAQASSYWDPSIAVWDALYGAGMLPRMTGRAHTDHTEAMHSSIDIGNLHITMMDRVSMGEGGGTADGVLYGNAQIDDCLADIDGPGDFKLLCLPNCWRKLIAGAGDDVSLYGANEPLADFRATEAARLMTAAVTGIMARQAASGWKFGVVTGDHHNPQALRHENSGGAVAESFVQIVVGTSGGGQNHTTPAAVVPGLVYNGTTVLYAEQRLASDFKSSWGVVEIVPAAETNSGREEMRMHLISESWRTRWSGAWLDNQVSNLPVPIRDKSAICVATV